MSNEAPTALILGGTGRTGSLLAGRLARAGMATRTASRRGADVRFDWDVPATHPDALAGVDRLYLVTPVLRVSYADQVARFLDVAETAGVRHVTLLSTHNADRAPRGIDLAAVEADLAARQALTHTVLRPAWVMQNFTDDHLPVIDGVITAPSGGHTEAFVDADDIAAVAARTLLDPGAHAGARYTLTGPQALTFRAVADIIATATGRPVRYNDVDQNAWIDGALAAGVPADYAVMLRWLTGEVIAGNGSKPTDDIERVTGRPPTTFNEFAQRNAQVWSPAWTPAPAPAFGANSPFFRIIKEGLGDLVDGADYFDLLAEDVVFEYVISVPGYPRRVEGRQHIVNLYSGYGDYMQLHSADNLRVHWDPRTSVVVLEYEVHGTSVQTGRPYDNRFVSVVTVKDRKVAHWRDYLDPVAVFDASGWPQGPR